MPDCICPHFNSDGGCDAGLACPTIHVSMVSFSEICNQRKLDRFAYTSICTPSVVDRCYDARCTDVHPECDVRFKSTKISKSRLIDRCITLQMERVEDMKVLRNVHDTMTHNSEMYAARLKIYSEQVESGRAAINNTKNKCAAVEIMLSLCVGDHDKYARSEMIAEPVPPPRTSTRKRKRCDLRYH